MLYRSAGRQNLTHTKCTWRIAGENVIRLAEETNRGFALRQIINHASGSSISKSSLARGLLGGHVIISGPVCRGIRSCNLENLATCLATQRAADAIETCALQIDRLTVQRHEARCERRPSMAVEIYYRNT